MGRPPDAGEARKRIVMVRLTDEEHDELDTARRAKALSTYVRERALAAARRGRR